MLLSRAFVKAGKGMLLYHYHYYSHIWPFSTPPLSLATVNACTFVHGAVLVLVISWLASGGGGRPPAHHHFSGNGGRLEGVR